MSDADQLKALRVRIDSLDEKILELISERARCAQDVARVKMASLPEGEKPVFYRPEREACPARGAAESSGVNGRKFHHRPLPATAAVG